MTSQPVATPIEVLTPRQRQCAEELICESVKSETIANILGVGVDVILAYREERWAARERAHIERLTKAKARKDGPQRVLVTDAIRAKIRGMAAAGNPTGLIAASTGLAMSTIQRERREMRSAPRREAQWAPRRPLSTGGLLGKPKESRK